MSDDASVPGHFPVGPMFHPSAPLSGPLRCPVESAGAVWSLNLTVPEQSVYVRMAVVLQGILSSISTAPAVGDTCK